MAQHPDVGEHVAQESAATPASRKKISLRTERGMSNSFQKARGGTTIAEHSTRMMSGTYSDSQNRLRGRHGRHPLAQVLVGERDVAGLLGHVDRHHPLHDRVQPLALAQHVLLGVVDGLLAREHPEEERRSAAGRRPAGSPAGSTAAAGAYPARRRRCGSPSPGTSWCGCTLRPPRAGSTGTPASRWAPRRRTPSDRGSECSRNAGRPWRRWPAATCRSRSGVPAAAPCTKGGGRSGRLPAGSSARRCRPQRTRASPSRCRCTD